MKFKVLYLPQQQGTKYIRISYSQYNFKKLLKHKVEIK